jgi:hypothetical protein
MTPASRTLGDGRVKVPLGKVGCERKVGRSTHEGDLLEQLEDRGSDQVKHRQEVPERRQGKILSNHRQPEVKESFEIV